MYVLSRDFFFFFFIVRLLRCLGMAGNNHPKTERGTTADDGLSTRKSSWWCLCYVISGNAADGGLFFLAFAVAPSLLLLAAALVRAMTNECAGDRATYTSRSGTAADFMSD